MNTKERPSFDEKVIGALPTIFPTPRYFGTSRADEQAQDLRELAREVRLTRNFSGVNKISPYTTVQRWKA